MNLTIDGQPRVLDISPDATFSDVMLMVSKVSAAPGMGVTKVKLNGEDITGTDWTRLSSMAAGEIQSLEVSTGDTSILAAELLDSLDDFTLRLIGELGRSAEYFRIGDQQKAMQAYTRTLDGIQLLNYTSGLIERNLGINTAGISFAGKPSNEFEQKLPPVIEDMLTAQEKGDWVLLADLIEYELIPQFEDRRQILQLWREAQRAIK
jgi:hypothetical protein